MAQHGREWRKQILHGPGCDQGARLYFLVPTGTRYSLSRVIADRIPSVFVPWYVLRLETMTGEDCLSMISMY